GGEGQPVAVHHRVRRWDNQAGGHQGGRQDVRPGPGQGGPDGQRRPQLQAQDGLGRQHPDDPRGGQGPEQNGGAEGGDQAGDQLRGQSVAPADDHHYQEQGGSGEVAQAEEEGGGAQERLAPQE